MLRRNRYPPKFLTDLYFKWARTVDPLLYENPMWWQAIEWVNLLVLTPYALLAVIGFPLGWRWLRNPGMIVSSFTAYSLAAIIPATLYVRGVPHAGASLPTSLAFHIHHPPAQLRQRPDPQPPCLLLGVYSLRHLPPAHHPALVG